MRDAIPRSKCAL